MTGESRHETDYRGPRDLLCDEAQADGVPCTELGRECETCERAHPRPDPRDRSADEGDLPPPPADPTPADSDRQPTQADGDR